MRRSSLERQAFKVFIVQKVLSGRLTRAAGTRCLGTSLRTLYSYIKKFRQKGADGLIDRRHGHARKITPEQEQQILLLKQSHRHLSARWIRDHLKLGVSVEAVRLVLAKHKLNGRRFAIAAAIGGGGRICNAVSHLENCVNFTWMNFFPLLDSLPAVF